MTAVPAAVAMPAPAAMPAATTGAGQGWMRVRTVPAMSKVDVVAETILTSDWDSVISDRI